MERPDEVHLSREDGEALRTRLAGDALTAADRRVLDQVLQWYFWLLFALQEAVQPQASGACSLAKALRTASPPLGCRRDQQWPGGPGSAPSVRWGRGRTIVRSRAAAFCCQAAPRPWPLGRRHTVAPRTWVPP